MERNPSCIVSNNTPQHNDDGKNDPRNGLEWRERGTRRKEEREGKRNEKERGMFAHFHSIH